MKLKNLLEKLSGKLMEAMIAVLPKQERQAATLVFVRGVRQVDAARELGVSQSNISRILKRACAQLRKEF